jgi:hypothetical protein
VGRVWRGCNVVVNVRFSFATTLTGVERIESGDDSGRYCVPRGHVRIGQEILRGGVAPDHFGSLRVAFGERGRAEKPGGGAMGRRPWSNALDALDGLCREWGILLGVGASLREKVAAFRSNWRMTRHNPDAFETPMLLRSRQQRRTHSRWCGHRQQLRRFRSPSANARPAQQSRAIGAEVLRQSCV